MNRFHWLVLPYLALSFSGCQVALGGSIVVNESQNFWSIADLPLIIITGKLLLCEDGSALRAVPPGTNGCGGFGTFSDTVLFDYSESDKNTLLIFFCSDNVTGDSDLADKNSGCATNTIANTWSIGEAPGSHGLDQLATETVIYTPIAGQPGFGVDAAGKPVSYQITSDCAGKAPGPLASCPCDCASVALPEPSSYWMIIFGLGLIVFSHKHLEGRSIT